MKVEPTTRRIASSGIKNSVSFGIKQDGFAHVFNVLRNQLYSNKYKAVLREYSTNAVDAHIEAGIPERPIEVTLPTMLNHNLKIRDFGPALTEEEVYGIYAFYGESTKRNTNSQTGMLGIGSKSAFAYGDNFVINSYVNGKKYVYNAFIDPSQVGQIAKLSEEDSTEESGIEIVIPVNEKDVDKFCETAKEIFQHFKVRPIIKGQEIKFDDREVLFKNNNWKWLKDPKNENGHYATYLYQFTDGATVVMGNIGYPINFDSLNYVGENYGEIRNLCNRNLVLNVEIGDLEISASREQLQYTERTRNFLIKTLENARNEIIDILKNEFAGCKTMFEAKCFIGAINDIYSGLFQFRDLINKNITVNGIKVESSQFWFGGYADGDVKIRALRNPRRGRKLRLDFTNAIDCNKDTVVILNDTKASQGFMNRLLPLAIEEKKYVFVITFRDEEIQSKIEKDLGFDIPMRKFSELPVRKLNEFEGYGNGVRVRAGSVKNSKHLKKVFSVDWSMFSKFRNRLSDYWNIELVDFSKEKGIYVVIDKFAPVGKNGIINDFRRWDDIKTCLEKLKINVPKVIGVKRCMADALSKNNNWTEFGTWLKESIKNSAKTYTQQIVDNRKCFEATSNLHWVLSPSSSKEEFLKNLIDKNGKMAKFYEAFDKMMPDEKSSDLIENITKIMNKLQIEIKFDNINPTFDLEKMAKEVEDRYELITDLNSLQYCCYVYENSRLERLANYVNVIDVCSIKNSKNG